MASTKSYSRCSILTFKLAEDGVVFACSVKWVRSVHFVVGCGLGEGQEWQQPPDSTQSSAPLRRNSSIFASNHCLHTAWGLTAFTRTLISQTQSVVRKSYLSLVSQKKFSCALRQTEKTYLWLQLWHLHLAPCQRCRRTCIPQSHPPVVYWFYDKKRNKAFPYIINFQVQFSWLISCQVSKVAYFWSTVISLDCKLWKLGGLTKPGEGRILA